MFSHILSSYFKCTRLHQFVGSLLKSWLKSWDKIAFLRFIYAVILSFTYVVIRPHSRKDVAQ